MTVAIIIAAGSGLRMHLDIPKQFLNVNGKPVLIYTLETFQNHPGIDKIEVVCLEGWSDFLWKYAKQYGITKLEWVIPGGATGQESIRNGVYHLKNICQPDDIVVIHDGIRPLMSEEVLSDVLVKCRQFGNGVAALLYNEQLFKVEADGLTTKEYIPRETVRRVQTPQAYRFQKLLWAYDTAFATNVGIFGSSYTNTMMVELGETLYLAAGSERNIKITTSEDLDLLHAMLNLKKKG